LSEPLLQTPLHSAHLAAGARMVAFAGYDMPVQYKDGVLREHLWTREHAGAFDVSHMGPAFLTLNERTGDPDADHRAVAAIVESLVCGDIAGLKRGQLRYTLLLNEEGGMVDDLMVGRPVAEDRQGMLYLVVNAATKDGDFDLIEKAAADRARLIRADDRALIALQGPEAAEVLSVLIPEAVDLGFMRFRRVELHGEGLVVSRSGYTGEDGFEILVPASIAEAFWSGLLADERVRPIGLGARDSLRLEAGLPLYGHDADATVSPIEANLAFAVSKKRLKSGDFPGAARIARERGGDLRRLRVGLRVLDGAPAREGAEILDGRGETVGRVTSGGFAPSLSAPIAMGFVPPLLGQPGTPLKVVVRGKAQPAEVVPLPFVPHRYVRNA
jgi:aminomethyltransferase